MSADAPRTTDDVRMRGFARRATVAECLQWIDRHAAPLEAETVELAEAAGRVLAEDAVAGCDVPGFDRAAMDGYAVRADDTLGATDYNPLTLTLIGESLPGRGFHGTIGPSRAARIMTGAPLPAGADAVAPAEFAEEDASNSAVNITAAVAPGKHVSRRGEDVRSGTRVAAAGRRLRPQDLGVLSSIGHATLRVRRRPQVRLVVTGGELLPPGTPPTDYRIADANSPMLAALVQRDGGVPQSPGLVADTRDAIRAALRQPGADVVLVSGGSSVGAEDHAPLVLAEEGQLAIHGVAMRPSSPAGMGRIRNRLVFLLPGNPVSCLCAYDFFAGRAIRRLGGLPAEFPYRAELAPLARKISSAVGRLDYVRVRLVEGQVEPLATSGASILTSTTRADGFVLVPEQSEGFPAGAEVEVYRYD
ncbi:MAG: gephyrin-like molybdotransferase Glp [Pirellulales bacterium]